MKVTIISFSGRQNGNCEKIADIISAKYSNDDTTVYKFSQFTIHPCANCNYECFKKDEQCPYIADNEYRISEAVSASDISYYIVPNYCDFPCSNFFTFNERGQCYLQNNSKGIKAYAGARKKFIVVSNTNQENFIRAFQAHTNGAKPDILFLSARKYGHSSIKGDLDECSCVVEEILAFIDE